jgi:soluble lytic murein transglycosylase-like protein
MLPDIPVPLHCINKAAIEYNIPAKLLIALLQAERGKVGQLIKNKNGSYDIGPAQINSSWLPVLKMHGITQAEVQFDPCINIKVGAWIAAKAIASENNLLSGIGDYNSHTRQYNQSYCQKIRFYFTKLYMLLDE